MKPPLIRAVTAEAKLLLIGIPLLIWTLLPIYHLFLFSISPKEFGVLWKIVAGSSDVAQFRCGVQTAALLPPAFLAAALELATDCGYDGRSDFADRDRGCVRD